MLQFQSPRSGKFESNVLKKDVISSTLRGGTFQSPRSGKFESNYRYNEQSGAYLSDGFNPLDRGNLNQISCLTSVAVLSLTMCFNPLDRGNLNQISTQ